jgi:hypothetical protein
VAGHRTAVAGHHIAVAGYQTAVAGYQTAMGGYQTAVAGYQTAVAGYQTAVAGYQTACMHSAVMYCNGRIPNCMHARRLINVSPRTTTRQTTTTKQNLDPRCTYVHAGKNKNNNKNHKKVDIRAAPAHSYILYTVVFVINNHDARTLFGHFHPVFDTYTIF